MTSAEPTATYPAPSCGSSGDVVIVGAGLAGLFTALKLAPSGAPSVEIQAVREEEASRVRRAVKSLPESLRRVIMLCELAELSYEEVGRVLGIPAGTVGSRRHRALGLLRERLGEDSH